MEDKDLDLMGIRLMLKNDEDVKELINLKSTQISESESRKSTTDLDESLEKAEEEVINIFLDKIEQAQNYVWMGFADNQPEFKDAITFISIMGYVLSNGDPDVLPPRTRNKDNYTVGLSYLSGMFCFANQLIVNKFLKRTDLIQAFHHDDLVCKATKHYVHTYYSSPYVNYNRPFQPIESQTPEEIKISIKADSEFGKFLDYCWLQQEIIFKQVAKMLKL